MTFFSSRTGVLVVAGAVGVGVGAVGTGTLRLAGVVGAALVAIGLWRRGSVARAGAQRAERSARGLEARCARVAGERDRLAPYARGEHWRRRILETTGRLPVVQVHSHHKVASKFTRRLLEDLARRNGLRFGTMLIPEDDPAPSVAVNDIFFLRNADRRVQGRPGFGGIHFVRNPFALVTSAYFSHLKVHRIDLDVGRWDALAERRERMRRMSEHDGIHLTIEFLAATDFLGGAPGPLLALETWDYDDPGFVNLRMEDFVLDPVGTLAASFDLVGLELPDPADHTFAAVSDGRRPGETDPSHHYRSGDPEDWRRHLDVSHLEAIRAVCPTLIARMYPEVAAATAGSAP